MMPLPIISTVDSENILLNIAPFDKIPMRGRGPFGCLVTVVREGAEEDGKTGTRSWTGFHAGYVGKPGLEDVIIEALESPVHDWVLGVQFLPQRRGEIPPHFDKLFNILVEKAKSTI